MSRALKSDHIKAMEVWQVCRENSETKWRLSGGTLIIPTGRDMMCSSPFIASVSGKLYSQTQQGWSQLLLSTQT